ncbi:hypothetical protein ACIHAA_27440 [Streptomyces sp. NPDC052040]|uniref:hypothetical protein n=1 Tax=Streptomyces sp. NPDC052040 TaxID=3365682 RepID=UPI0037CEC72B
MTNWIATSLVTAVGLTCVWLGCHGWHSAMTEHQPADSVTSVACARSNPALPCGHPTAMDAP